MITRKIRDAITANFVAGDRIADIELEFDLPPCDVEDVLRDSLKSASKPRRGRR